MSVDPLVSPSVIIESKSKKKNDRSRCVCVWVGVWVQIGVGRPCPPVCGDIVNPRYIIK